MSYNKKNYMERCAHAMRLTSQYYEPGRHDRCYHWVWKRHIKEQFHVEYRTYMKWLRDVRRTQEDDRQLTLF